jgi:transcriptional regulator with XRE-family HTH domain
VGPVPFAHGHPFSVKTLGERVKHARERKEWSQARLEAEARLSQGMVSRLERNERGPAAETLTKLSTSLGVRSDWLLNGVLPMEAAEAQPDAVPNRAEAARLCRDDGVHDEAIRRVLDEPADARAVARSVLWWADRMRFAQREMIADVRTDPQAAGPSNDPPVGFKAIARALGEAGRVPPRKK